MCLPDTRGGGRRGKCRKRHTFPDSKQKITGTLVICYLFLVYLRGDDYK